MLLPPQVPHLSLALTVIDSDNDSAYSTDVSETRKRRRSLQSSPFNSPTVSRSIKDVYI